MKRIVTVVIALGALLMTMAGTAAAEQGVTAEKLQNAGWDCFDIPPLGTHCTQGGLGTVLAGEVDTVHVMVFDLDDGEFLGTELLVHDDIFNDQPCPQDGGEYMQVAPDYWACHHYETAH